MVVFTVYFIIEAKEALASVCEKISTLRTVFAAPQSSNVYAIHSYWIVLYWSEYDNIIYYLPTYNITLARFNVILVLYIVHRVPYITQVIIFFTGYNSASCSIVRVVRWSYGVLFFFCLEELMCLKNIVLGSFWSKIGKYFFYFILFFFTTRTNISYYIGTFECSNFLRPTHLTAKILLIHSSLVYCSYFPRNPVMYNIKY